ncbi:hypothetical protein [Nocardioides cremeus]|nr:hypothetical protein [Nocardioides cremeus]
MDDAAPPTLTALAARIEGDGDPLARLAAATELRSLLVDLEVRAVREARASQVPWSLIGDGLGISKQAAQKRYAEAMRPEQEADTAAPPEPEVAAERPAFDARRRRSPGWVVMTRGGRTLLRVERARPQ